MVKNKNATDIHCELCSVTGDEIWINRWTPKSKMHCIVWKGKKEAALKKTKVVESAGKVMATVLWDSKDVLLD